VLSIVIPARNDAAALSRTLTHLDGLHCRQSTELIVAASEDVKGTIAAVGNRARLLWPEQSTRAALMNASAAAARGDALLFLHADSLPPPNACCLIRATLEDEQVVGGAFEHRFLERDWRLRVISGLNRLRYRVTQNYYGDQGIFVRASVFRQVGGFRGLSIMEDVDLSQRLKRLGRTRLIRASVDTSGRRFLERGPWRTLFGCGWLLTLWALGMETERYGERWRGRPDRPPGSR
jgi:rSAM/selenodomain-associated transferase 2